MDILDFIIKKEYNIEYDLSFKKKYSEPKICSYDGDTTKRWYIYYSYRNPKTGKLERQRPIYKNAHQIKDAKKRLEYLTVYKTALINLLEQGYNPFESASVTKQRIEAEQKEQQATKTNESKESYTVRQALDFAFEQKQPFIGNRAIITMRGHKKRFLAWLKKRKLDIIDVSELKRREISTFLNSLKKYDKHHKLTDQPVGAKTRNSYRTSLATLFSQMVSDDIIDFNPVTAIPKLKENTKKHKPFTNVQVKDMVNYMDENDPYLRKFTQFIAYAFLRNVEVCRLRVKDIDLKNRRIYVKTKTQAMEVVPIIDKLAKVIDQMELHKYKPSDFVFSKTEVPSDWSVSEKAKTEHFYDRFIVMKKALNLEEDQTLYGFKHTAAINLYNSLASEGKAHEQVLTELMGFTRHKTKSQLMKYLRGIGASLAKDFSNKYTIDF